MPDLFRDRAALLERHADLPAAAIAADVLAALKDDGRAVLSAPPGAGKTTLMPLALLCETWFSGKIILVEPRRLAARAAARRMAAMIGEEAGETVGYRMRLDTRVSAKTRIEVVTEGVFTRMALDDPELSGIGAVFFDEFHERALEADFGLALALDIRAGLRDDLRLLIMSATLDAGQLAARIGQAAVIVSDGRSFPVEIRHQARPPGERIEETMARAILSALRDDDGSLLAFLPGQGEIRRTAQLIEGKCSPDVIITPLYGGLSGKEQDAAIRPAANGLRKVVLATPVAESSITIDGVRIVIDSGLERRPVFEPATGVTRLETVRISQASADQRAGRAGRTAPGIAIRLWNEAQTGSMARFAPAEILSSDLSGLLLDSMAWGVADPTRLPFIDPPPEIAISEARVLLQRLGALDEKGQLTPVGKAMRDVSLPPRLAAMVIKARQEGYGQLAGEIAVLLTEQGLGGPDVDLDIRLPRFRAAKDPRSQAARDLGNRIGGGGKSNVAGMTGSCLVAAFPDRIAMQRGGRGRYVLANGRGAILDENDALAGEPFLVVADLTGKAGAPRVLAAAALSGPALEETLADHSLTEDQTVFDPASRSVKARRVTRLGAIILKEAPLSTPAGEEALHALGQGIRKHGLSLIPFGDAAYAMRARMGFLNRSLGDHWPDVDDHALLDRLEDWFLSYQPGLTSLRETDQQGLLEGLLSLAGPNARHEIDRLAPSHYLAPTGSRLPIDYSGEEPVLAVRVQELYGEKAHPSVAGGRLPLTLSLLSPAHRPIQTTRDLPGFWSGSWADVRSDMRGRYPRHPWPENPADAEPTRRAKPRRT